MVGASWSMSSGPRSGGADPCAIRRTGITEQPARADKTHPPPSVRRTGRVADAARSGFDPSAPWMVSRSCWFLCLPIAVAAFAPASGWILFMGHRRAGRAPATPDHHEAAEGQVLELLDLRDRRSGSSPGASRSTPRIRLVREIVRLFDDENDELFEPRCISVARTCASAACSSPPGVPGPRRRDPGELAVRSTG